MGETRNVVVGEFNAKSILISLDDSSA
jgi:hypothetical protein